MIALSAAIMQAEALTTQEAGLTLAKLGFGPDQFDEPAEIARLKDGSIILRTELGFISCAHSAEAEFSESLSDLVPDYCTIGSHGASLYAEAAWRLDLYRPNGFHETDAPWRLMAAQYAAVVRVEIGNIPQFEPGEHPQERHFGEKADDGVALYFTDGSLYYSDGGRHEVWADSDDFERGNGPA